MDFRRLFRRYIPLRWQRTGGSDPISIVLLQRVPHFFSAAELRLAAEKTWGASFTNGGANSMRRVKQSGNATLMKAGPHLLNFFQYPRPYIDNPESNVDRLPLDSQRQAWVEHSAYVAVDYLNRNVDLDLAYCILSGLVAEMLDENCTGIYVPRESSLSPNDRSLYSELRRIALSRDSGVGATK